MKNRLAKVGAMVMTVAVLATSTVPVLASEEIPAFSDGPFNRITMQQNGDCFQKNIGLLEMMLMSEVAREKVIPF